MHSVTDVAAAWPIVGRDDELCDAMASLQPDSEFQGVALIGDCGVGKSTLARALGSRLTAERRTVRSVLGTQTGRDMPLGAFSRLVTVDQPREPAAMLATAHRMLAVTGNPVIIVDDAQLLDPLSATLVYQLAAEGTAHLIVVIRSGEPTPDAVTALLKERLLSNLHISPFTREQTGELARRVLGGVVSSRLINGLHDRSSGSPLYLRGLLRAGRENAVLVQDEDGWQLKGTLFPDRELSDLLEFRLQTLTPDELEALEVLSTAEVLDWEIFRELCSPHAVSGLERHRLIHLASDGAGTLAQVTHPIFGEAVLRRAGVARARQLNGVLAQAFDEYLHGGGRRLRLPDIRGRIRMAQFMTRSDLQPDLELITEAAIQAAAMSNLALAEDLARFAWERGGDLLATLVLGDALCWQGRGDEAESILVDTDLDDADEELTVQWGCLRASNLFWNYGEIDGARKILADSEERAHSETSAALPQAVGLAITFFAGDLATAVRIGPKLCESKMAPVATALAAVPTAHALTRAGRFGDAARIVDIGSQALLAAPLRPSGAIPYGLGLAQVTALIAAGDHLEAELVVEHYATMAAGVPEPDAMAGVLLGLVKLARGQLPLACAAFQGSTPILSGCPPSLWPMLGNAWCTQAEAERGNVTAASAALRHCEEAYGPQVAIFLPELELARAWERVATGQTSEGRVHAMRAAQIARRSGMYTVEMRALHTAVRFGDRTHADRLAELAKELETPMSEAVALHARGLAHHNGDLLSSTSESFATMGALASAADAAAQASCEYARSGQRGKQLETSTRAQWLAGQGDVHTPAVVAATQPLPITGREREIAMLVAAGLPNRQIAERLSVSVRTVDGHLYRMFSKLGIERRDQLVSLLSGFSSEA